jgi:hypothetical protein
MDKVLTYFAQASSILVFLGLFVNQFLNKRNKRDEIRYNLFYSRKLENHNQLFHQVLTFDSNVQKLEHELGLFAPNPSKNARNEIRQIYLCVESLVFKNLALANKKEKVVLQSINEKCKVVSDYYQNSQNYFELGTVMDVVGDVPYEEFVDARNGIRQLLDELVEITNLN